MKKISALLLGAALACPVTAAAPAPAPALPSLDPGAAETARTLVSQGRIQSLAIGLVEDGCTVTYAFGVLDSARPEPPDADTVFEIGSLTKTFTALLLADAAERKELVLEDPAGALLPGWTLPGAEGRPITLLDLATQTSGLPRLPGNLVPRDLQDPYRGYGQPELKVFLAEHRLGRRPGESYEYSNLGYGLLGTALAQRAKAAYGDLVTARIAGPLGLEDTGTTLTPRMRAHLAPGHADGKTVPGWDMGALAGAGALKSTLRDMLVYLRAHLRPETAPAGPLRAALAQVQRPLRPAMEGVRIGLAWHVQGEPGHEIVWHNGGTGGYATFAGFTADSRRGIVILANSAAPEVTPLGLRALLGSAPAPTEVPVDPKILPDYLGTYALTPTFKLTLTVEAGHLFAQATGQPRLPLTPSGPDAFFYKAVDAQVTFERGPDGKVKALVLQQNGQRVRGVRE